MIKLRFQTKIHSRTHIVLIIFCLISLLFVGCKGQEKSKMERNFERLQQGMAISQVVAIMGKPSETKRAQDDKTLRFAMKTKDETWFFWDNDIWERTTVVFRNGKLDDAYYDRRDNK